MQRGPEPTTLAVATIDTSGSAAYSCYVEGTAKPLPSDNSPEQPLSSVKGTVS